MTYGAVVVALVFGSSDIHRRRQIDHVAALFCATSVIVNITRPWWHYNLQIILKIVVEEIVVEEIMV